MTNPAVPAQHGIKKPTVAFSGAAWAAFAIFATTYAVCLWRMNIPAVEVFFYVTVALFGLFGVISVVKSVRDKEDGVSVTPLFYGLSWVAAVVPLGIMGMYLLQVSALDELQRGLLFLTFMAAIFASIVIQKNVRDMEEWKAQNPPQARVKQAKADVSFPNGGVQ